MTCETELKRLDSGDWRGWSGLPAGCGPQQLAAVFQGGDTVIPGRLSGQPTPLRIYRSVNQKEEIHAWFDDAHVFLLTLDSPTTDMAADSILQAWGSPEKKLHPLVGMHADAPQWIYASRGFTVFVRERDGGIARVAAYRPSSVEYYEQYLGATDKKHYVPRR